MERIFWVQCPKCECRWYADWELRRSRHALICPGCSHEFPAADAAWLDERERP